MFPHQLDNPSSLALDSQRRVDYHARQRHHSSICAGHHQTFVILSGNTVLISELQFQFSDAQKANRFLNELTHWTSSSGNVAVKAKLAKGSDTVSVKYQFDGKGFDYTCSELDDLANQYGGEEV